MLSLCVYKCVLSPAHHLEWPWWPPAPLGSNLTMRHYSGTWGFFSLRLPDPDSTVPTCSQVSVNRAESG